MYSIKPPHPPSINARRLYIDYHLIVESYSISASFYFAIFFWQNSALLEIIMNYPLKGALFIILTGNYILSTFCPYFILSAVANFER